MASKKDADQIKVTVMCDIIVSERQWRDLMEANGRSMSGVVTPAHVQKAAKAILKKNFEKMGFSQPHIPDYS